MRAHSWLWATLVGAALFLLFTLGPFEVLLPYIIRNDLDGGEAASTATVLAAGGPARSSAPRWWAVAGAPRRHVTFMWCRVGIGTMLVIGLAFAQTAWVMCLISFVNFALGTAALVVWNTLMNTLVPRELLGRVSSFDWFVSFGLTPLSFAVTGPVAALIGARETLALAGALGGAHVCVPVHPRGSRPGASADLVDVTDVGSVARVLARRGLEPAVEYLLEQRRAGRRAATAPARSRRSTCARRGPSRRRRRARLGCRRPCSRRSTRRSRSSSTRPPGRRVPRPRRGRRPRRTRPSPRDRRRRARRAGAARGRARRSSSTTASATPVRSSAATEILIALSLLLGSMPELPEVEITARRLSRGTAARPSSRRWRRAWSR